MHCIVYDYTQAKKQKKVLFKCNTAKSMLY